MTISDRGLAFIAAHEGFVSKAYRDPVGVVTIGYGFTMGSAVFRSWWTKRHGRGLKLGDRLSRSDANTLLRALVETEYAPPVDAALPGLPQHRRDACISVVYNLGPRALSWKWAAALKAGNPAEAARLLEKTGTTARGKRLPGLARRRREEAALLLGRGYGTANATAKAAATATAEAMGAGRPAPRTAWAQKTLAQLGYQPGAVDGLAGPRTQAALRRFQKDNPPLLVDGTIGPATLSALKRKQAAKGQTLAGLGGGALVAGALSLTRLTPLELLMAAVAVSALLAAAGLLWRFRGLIAARVR